MVDELFKADISHTILHRTTNSLQFTELTYGELFLGVMKKDRRKVRETIGIVDEKVHKS